MKKKLLSILTASALFVGLISPNSFAYSDISGHWAENDIRILESNGCLNHFPGDRLYPDQYINRAECAELISNFFSGPAAAYNVLENSPNKFWDLNPSYYNTNLINSLSRLWYVSTMTSASDENYYYPQRIINGYPDGSFQPYANVTRAEFAKMLGCALDCFGMVTSGDIPYHYSDVFGVDPMSGYVWEHWAKRFIGIMYKMNIMNGYSSYIARDGIPYVEYRPDNNITRAEAIKMVNYCFGFDTHYPGEAESTRLNSNEPLYFYE